MIKKILKKCVVVVITWEARMVLKKYHPKVIAVTGNVGKTSTKDAIFTLLQREYFVRKSAKSFNSDIGVPLTILGRGNAWLSPVAWVGNIIAGAILLLMRREYPVWLILEIGADRPGDIKSIASWITPDVVVVTQFSKTPVHIEFFPSRDALIQEKSYLVRALKDTGIAIVSADDPDTLSFRSLVRGKVITFGFSHEADVAIGVSEPSYRRGVRGIPDGYRMQIKERGALMSVRWKGSVGRQHCSALAAAAAFGLSVAEMPRDKVAMALSNYEAPPGRMCIIEGIKKTTIIDDTYNASPLAVAEALRTLWVLTVMGRRIAVLGDMLELGKFSIDEHKEIGRIAAESAQMVVTVGIRSRGIIEGALAHGMSEHFLFSFDHSREAGVFLQNYIRASDVILVKGSQALRMERVVEEIMAHPELADRLLVRQEPEWKERS